jgi:hypothetical protein
MLDDTVAGIKAATGLERERTFVDKGYRGHDYDKPTRVFHSSYKSRADAPHQAHLESPLGHRVGDRLHEIGRTARPQLPQEPAQVVRASF